MLLRVPWQLEVLQTSCVHPTDFSAGWANKVITTVLKKPFLTELHLYRLRSQTSFGSQKPINSFKTNPNNQIKQILGGKTLPWGLLQRC